MKLLARALCATALLCICSLVTQAQVSVSLAPVPRISFLSASGAPLSGGFVYVLCAGTSTPCPSYLDSTGTSLATNPIVLDSGGMASIWLPAGPVDIAVQNSSFVQQYKILNVTALPSTVSSLTAGYFQSSRNIAALSGFLRMASADQMCWRNLGNSADLCLNTGGADRLSFGSQPVALLDTVQNWNATQIFGTEAISMTSSTNPSVFGTFEIQAATTNQVYIFPDLGSAGGGVVCVSGLTCNLQTPNITLPTINGVVVNSIPTDYDDYSLKLVTTSGNVRTNTIPSGALQPSPTGGSFLEIETTFFAGAFTGSAPTYGLLVNGQSIATITISAGLRYDVRCTIAEPVNSGPTAVCVESSNSPALVNVEQATLAQFTGSSFPITESLTFSGTANLSAFFQHVRIRK